MSPGYFDPVVATHLVKNGVIYEPATSGSVLLTDDLLIFDHNHTANTDGPTTPGWTAAAPYRVKTFNLAILFPGVIPPNANNVIIRMISILDADTVALSNQMNLFSRNSDAIYNSFFNNQIVRTNSHGATPTLIGDERDVLVQWSPDKPTLQFGVDWPNVAIVLPNTNVSALLLGYTG